MKKTECTVDMNISAYIPESYIKAPYSALTFTRKYRLLRTSRTLSILSMSFLTATVELPKPVAALLDVSLLRSLGFGMLADEDSEEGKLRHILAGEDRYQNMDTARLRTARDTAYEP